MQETWVQSLGLVDPLEKEMSTHSRIFAWRIPWTEEPGGLQSMGSQKSRKQLSNQITSSSDCVKSGSHYLCKPFYVFRLSWRVASSSNDSYHRITPHFHWCFGRHTFCPGVSTLGSWTQLTHCPHKEFLFRQPPCLLQLLLTSTPVVDCRVVQFCILWLKGLIRCTMKTH